MVPAKAAVARSRTDRRPHRVYPAVSRDHGAEHFAQIHARNRDVPKSQNADQPEEAEADELFVAIDPAAFLGLQGVERLVHHKNHEHGDDELQTRMPP